MPAFGSEVAQPAVLGAGDMDDCLAQRPQPHAGREVELGVTKLVQSGQQTAADVIPVSE